MDTEKQGPSQNYFWLGLIQTWNLHFPRAFTCTAAAISSVNTAPRIYASMRFSIPHIIGEMKIYDEHTYVITKAGRIPMTTGLPFLNRYTVIHHNVITAKVWLHQAK